MSYQVENSGVSATSHYEYVHNHDDAEKWMLMVWLALAATGELPARSTEQDDLDSYRPKSQ